MYPCKHKINEIIFSKDIKQSNWEQELMLTSVNGNTRLSIDIDYTIKKMYVKNNNSCGEEQSSFQN